MRLSTVVWLFLMAGMIAGVFHLKYKVQSLEGDLAAVNAAVRKDKDAIHILRAEWSYLNRPERLRALSKRRLRLAPITESQNVRFADLPRSFDAPTTTARSIAARPSKPNKRREKRR